jgi:hypothetical protein
MVDAVPAGVARTFGVAGTISWGRGVVRNDDVVAAHDRLAADMAVVPGLAVGAGEHSPRGRARCRHAQATMSGARSAGGAVVVLLGEAGSSTGIAIF